MSGSIIRQRMGEIIQKKLKGKALIKELGKLNDADTGVQPTPPRNKKK